MNTGKRNYRRSKSKKQRWETRNNKKIYHTRKNTGKRKRYGKWRRRDWYRRWYRTHAKRPILGDREWDAIFKFERKWGVMRQSKEWPKF